MGIRRPWPIHFNTPSPDGSEGSDPRGRLRESIALNSLVKGLAVNPKELSHFLGLEDRRQCLRVLGLGLLTALVLASLLLAGLGLLLAALALLLLNPRLTAVGFPGLGFLQAATLMALATGAPIVGGDTPGA